MVILDPNGMTFDAVGVFGLAFQLLFKSGSSYCALIRTGLSSATFDQINVIDIFVKELCPVNNKQRLERSKA
jgi:hypothetical protein